MPAEEARRAEGRRRGCWELWWVLGSLVPFLSGQGVSFCSVKLLPVEEVLEP